MAEFFVMHKYRRMGVGEKAFKLIMSIHKGKWQLMRHPKNTASVHFWDNVISRYTSGHFELAKSHPEALYEGGVLGDIFFFES